MTSSNHLSLLFGLALSLLLSLVYKFPQASIEFLGRQPLLVSWGYRDAYSIRTTENNRQLCQLLDSDARVKHEITLQVIRGERTLLQAAAAFRRLKLRLQRFYKKPEDLDGFGYCRQVINWIEVQVRSGDGLNRDEVLCQLEEAMYAAQDRNGKIELPQLPVAAYAELGSGSPSY